MKALLTLASIAAFLGVPLANATVEVRIINTAASGGGDTGWIQCAGTACSFAGTVGNYSVASDLATQDDAVNPFLDLSYSARTSSTNAGTIVIEAMADGYTYNAPEFEVVANGNSTITTTSDTIEADGADNDTICAASGASGTALSGLPPSQTPLTLGTPGTCTAASATGNTLLTTSFATPPNAYGFDGFSATGTTANPYSLGLSFTIASPSSAGDASGDVQLDAVPEPAAVTLFGAVLLFTVTAIRRKVRRTA